MTKQGLLMAAVAGISLGVGATHGAEGEKPSEVMCYGVNACSSDARCAVSRADLDAVKALLGEKEYAERWGKSEVHTCGASAKCGAGMGILNWTSASAADCKAKGGILIVGEKGKKVAKKA